MDHRWEQGRHVHGASIPITVPRHADFLPAAGQAFSFEFVHKRVADNGATTPTIFWTGTSNASPGTGWTVNYSAATQKLQLVRDNVTVTSTSTVNNLGLSH